MLMVGTPQNLGQAKKLLNGKAKLIITLKYAAADEVEKSLQKLVSSEGKVLSDVTSSTIYVEDYEENLAKMKDVIRVMDLEPKQVMIEAAILEVSLDKDTSLGIKWDWLDLPVEGASDVTGTISAQGFSSPAGISSTGFFAAVTNDHIAAFLDTLSINTDFNLLASPRLLALNDHKAEIIIGSKLGYKVTTTTLTGTIEDVEFLDVGTKLVITPHISGDGKILMEIHPEVSDGSISTAGLPFKQTTETTTTVLVGDGQTIVIGGLIRERGEEVISKVPGAGDIPLLGLFFRRKEMRNLKDEIIVLMTPCIVNDAFREADVQHAQELRNAIEKAKGKHKLP
jgi:type II secretory pathway component GspD/PulD (secretin)